jgi:hypothetical protein
VIHCAEVAGGEEATLETVSANRWPRSATSLQSLTVFKVGFNYFLSQNKGLFENCHGESVVLYPVCKDIFFPVSGA